MTVVRRKRGRCADEANRVREMLPSGSLRAESVTRGTESKDTAGVQ